MKQMYKVFLNDRLIQIGKTGKITINKPSVSFDVTAGKEEVLSWFRSFKKSHLQEVLLVHPQPEKFFRIFQSAFKNIPAAGGVVVSANRLLFIFRRGKWDLPKGKIEAGENPQEAAIREVAEECGITGHEIVKKLPSTFHIYLSPHMANQEEWIFKQTFWFEMAYSGNREGHPQTEEEITQIKWIPVHQLYEPYSNTFENLRQIIDLYRA